MEELNTKLEMMVWASMGLVRHKVLDIARDLEQADRDLLAFSMALPVPGRGIPDGWLTRDPRPTATKLETIITAGRSPLREATFLLKKVSGISTVKAFAGDLP